jgi:hypothetical protein
MWAIECILDIEDTIIAFWQIVQHDIVAALTLSTRSPFPPVWTKKNVPRGQTQVCNVNWRNSIDGRSAYGDEDNAPDSITGTKYWLDWYGDLVKSNSREDEREADNQSYINQVKRIKDLENPAQWARSVALNVPGLCFPAGWWKIQSEQCSMIVDAIETRRNKGNKLKYDRMGQYTVTRFFMLLHQEFHLYSVTNGSILEPFLI